MNKEQQEKGSYTNMKPHELRNYTCVVKTDSDEVHCTRNNPMTNNKQTYKPHDKTISPFSDFIINSTDEEKKRVFEVACELANQDQRDMLERANNKQIWREEMSSKFHNVFEWIKLQCRGEVISGIVISRLEKEMLNFIAKTLQEQREEVMPYIKDLNMMIFRLEPRNKELEDKIVELKDTLLKQLKK